MMIGRIVLGYESARAWSDFPMIDWVSVGHTIERYPRLNEIPCALVDAVGYSCMDNGMKRNARRMYTV